MATDDLVPVFDSTDPLELLMYRSRLEDAGISVMDRPSPEIGGAYLSDVIPTGIGISRHLQLLVFRKDAEQAVQVLAEYRARVEAGAYQLAADEEADESDPDEAEKDDSVSRTMGQTMFVVFVVLVLLTLTVMLANRFLSSR